MTLAMVSNSHEEMPLGPCGCLSCVWILVVCKMNELQTNKLTHEQAKLGMC